MGSCADIVVGAALGAAVATGVGIIFMPGAVAAAGGAAMYFGAAFATSLVLGGLSQALAKDPSTDGGTITTPSRLVTIRQASSPRQVIVGEVRVGGDLTFIHISSDNQYAHLIVTFAGHSCAGFGDIHFNDEVVPLDGSGNATGKYAGYVRIKKSLGDEGGTQPFSDLVTESGGKWTSAHLQRGCTKLYVRLTFNADLFSTGIPNITAVIRGLNTVTDSRTSTTGYSNNGPLLVAAYLANSTFGLGATFATEIDDATLDAQANIADERVSLATASATFTADASTDALTLATGSRIPQRGDGVRVASSGALPTGLSAATTYYAIPASGGTIQLATTFANSLAGTAIDLTSAGSGTLTLTYYDEPRYRINGAWRTSETPRAVLEHMLSAMAGSAVNVGGAWYLYAGAYEAPTVTLDEGDLAGPIHVQSLVSRRENANGVKGVFTSPDNSWQKTDFPPIASSTYLAEDGERVWKDIDLAGFVTSGTQAQRLAKIDLLRTRQALTVGARFKLLAYRAMTGRTVALSNTKFGWSDKAFEVTSSKFYADADGTLGVELGLRETAAAIYDWSTSEEQTIDIAPNTNLPDPATVGTPGVPSVTEALYETTGSAGVKTKAIVAWAAPSDVMANLYQLEWKLSTDSAWIVRPLNKSVNDEILDLEAGIYNFRVKAYNVFGVAGAYATVTKELIGLTAAPADVSNFAVQSYAGMAKFTWDKSTDLDVRIGGRVYVRWSPLTTGAVWNTGALVNPDGYAGDTTIGFGPLQTGTYLAKFCDSSGNYAANAAAFVATEALISGLSTLGSVTFHPTFTGTYSSTVVIDSTLQLAGSVLWDSMTGNLDDNNLIDWLGGVASSGSCTFTSKLDLGSVKQVRLYTTLKSEGFDTGDLWDFRTGLMDSWGLLDGSVIEDAEVKLMVRVTSDDPASGGATWGPWHPLGLVGDYSTRGFEFRADFTSANPTHNRKITELSVAAKQ